MISPVGKCKLYIGDEFVAEVDNVIVTYGKSIMGIKEDAFRLESAIERRDQLNKERVQLNIDIGELVHRLKYSCENNTVVVGKEYCLLVTIDTDDCYVTRCPKVE